LGEVTEEISSKSPFY